MFSVEHEFDSTTVTVLDDGGEEEDVAVIFFDDVVYIRQYYEDMDAAAVISMTPKMFAELMTAWNSAEGSYVMRNPNGV